MSKEKTLIKNTAIVSIGKILTQLISFLLLPLYTAYLSTGEYGTVDLVNTLTSLIIPFLTLQLDQSIFRYLIDVRGNEEEKKKYISSSIIFLILQYIVCTVIFLIISALINNPYKYFLLAILLINSFTNVLLQIARGMGDNVRYTIGSFIFAVVGIVLNVVFIVVFKMGAYGMLTATIIGHAVCIVYLFFTKKLYKLISIKSYEKKHLSTLLKYAFPLIPNAISWWIVNTSDRLIVTSFLGIATNGVYSVANKFSTVITTAFNIFNITWTESAAINYNDEDRNEFFNKIYNATFRIFGSICLGIIAIMPFVFNLLINEKYSEGYFQIPILIIATFFNILVSFIGSIYVAKKLTKEIAKTSILAAIINVASHLAMIKFIGLYAASISTLIAWMLMYIYRFRDVKKYVILKNSKGVIFSLLIILIATIIPYYMKNNIISAIMLIVSSIYIIMINKKNAKFMIDIFKNKFGKKENISGQV